VVNYTVCDYWSIAQLWHSGILEPEPEVKNDRTEAELESSNNGICCEAGNRLLVGDLETMKLESETDNNNSESESERSGDRVCVRVTGAHKAPGESSANITVCNYNTTHLQENPQRD